MNLGKESETVEHKRSTSELREGMESVASILNKHGHGALYFGVRPSDGEVVGQDVSEKTLRDVSQAFTNRIEPRVYPTVEHLVTEDGKSYIRATFSGDERPYACDGRYRIRSADEDLPMSAAALEGMMLERAAKRDPWDGRPSGRSLSEVDEDALRAYVERGVERRRIPFGYTDAHDVLSRLGLLTDDGGLTNAAAVCFCPSKSVMLRMGVLADSDRVHILDNRQEASTLFGLVDAAELYILNNIRRAFVIDGSSLHRKEVPEIPLSAIREALFNAFCHRRYEDDAATQIDIFWDAVDIYSPGSFPAGYAPEDYLSGAVTASKPRNQLIARTLYRSGDIETYGTGLRRIKAACDAQSVPVEVFERAGSVHVRFTRAEAAPGSGPAPGDQHRDGAAGDPDSREATVLRSARERGGITTAEAAELLGVKDYTARRILNAMADDGVLEKTGGRKGRVYKPVHGSF